MNTPPEQSRNLRGALLAGLIPLIVYTIAEETLGIVWGLILGMVFGIGEIAYELLRYRKVEAITLGSNAMLLILGGVSLLTQDGIWFKLQPAIMEGVMALVLLISVFMGKPLLVLLARKQGMMAKLAPEVAVRMEREFAGFTFRLSLFFASFAGVTVWASLYWTTRAWVFLKGIGFTVGFLAYGFLEILAMRYRISRTT